MEFDDAVETNPIFLNSFGYCIGKEGQMILIKWQVYENVFLKIDKLT